MVRHISGNISKTKKIAFSFVSSLLKKDLKKRRATVVGLYGDLGAGKTTFTQEVANHLGIKSNITSPTFVIMKSYPLKAKLSKNYNLQPITYNLFIHIDAYRIEKNDELKKLGWADIIEDPKNIIFIEWPEKIKDIMPNDHIKIKIKHIDENTREFDISIK
ncbi:MAG: tRNA (adenosine(37)-N6)-threonylcarbamoyltransferase complex ATPase subunit type 1 TsaE [Candidatus Paceibacterota bacterium]|jgi:tRNA threonylcarbamoyladenosine biosynthesis protein TsaE